MPTHLSSLLKFLLIGSCTASLIACQKAEQDFQPLEEVDGKAALEWVDASNAATQSKLGRSDLYDELYQQALAILSNPDRLPAITQKGKWVYNLWQDKDHVRGLYRRTLAVDFSTGSPNWQSVLDLDALSKAENKQWVLKGLNCLVPEYQRCLMQLSSGGGDAVEIREFDSTTLTFIDDGFFSPAAKQRVDWIDENTLFIGTAFGADSMTDSGYPRQVRRWQRGQKLQDAELIFTAQQKSVAANGHRYDDGHATMDIVTEALTFWENQYFILDDNSVNKLHLPTDAVIEDLVRGELLISLKSDWQFNGREFKQGAVILIKPAALINPQTAAAHDITILIEPSNEFIVEEIHATAKGILSIGLTDVKSTAKLYSKNFGKWQSQVLPLPQTGNLSIETYDFKSGTFFARYEDFLTPPSLYFVDQQMQPILAAQQPESFDGSQFKAQQFFATSKDGTKVPYFVVMNKSTPLNGDNPTHMFSYGGFRVSLKPSYSGSYEDLNGVYGKLWLERGGVFVLSNIRGGGEYGPAWHAAALKQNRHKAFEDFEAVARDLSARKITSAKHLGIEGRSNGGLLVGATMVRHPELYGAVVCGVPLLDMKRYHKLLAGASWMAEYGNPDVDSEWAFISTYSPFQKVDEKTKYPAILFYTSTRDDRVHPGHARKMAARMQAQGHQVNYYENREGGHGGSSTKQQLAKRVALGYAHLWENLQ